MNKKEFVNELATRLKSTKKDAEKVLEAVLETIKETVTTEDVKFAGFGIFTTIVKSERQARNPKTGETITVPTKKAVKFKVGKEFKELVNV